MRAHANVISRVCTIDKIQTRRSGKRGPACPVVAVATAEREYRATLSIPRVDVERIPSLVDDSEDEGRSQSFTTVLETTTTMTVRHGCCRSVVATARVQRRTRDKVALGLLLPVVSRARMRCRVEKTCERASELDVARAKEYEGKK